jgi:hypothetical protein
MRATAKITPFGRRLACTPLLLCVLCALCVSLAPLNAGCQSTAQSLGEIAVFQQDLEARVKAVRDLGVEADIDVVLTLDGKIGGLSQNLDGPLSGTVLMRLKVKPPTQPTGTLAETLAETLQTSLLARINERLEAGVFDSDEERIGLEMLRQALQSMEPAKTNQSTQAGETAERGTVDPAPGLARCGTCSPHGASQT